MINERDKVELSSFWAYQKLKNDMEISVNGKRFKVIDNYSNNETKNIHGSLDAVTFELKGTNQQFIAFQGTDNTEKINPNNPLRKWVADDWLENAKLMNANNKTTPLLRQTDNYLEDYNRRLYDAKKLTDQQFTSKYKNSRKNYLNKKLTGLGGNSQGGASSEFQGMQHPGIPVISTNAAMLPLSSYDMKGQPFYKNIIRYHDKFDILSWVQDPFAMQVNSPRIEIMNGIPTMKGLIASHLGYNRDYNNDTGKYKNIPVHTIVSVKDVEMKNGKYVPKEINLMVEMDDRIPINVWTGKAVAPGESSGLIKLDIDNISRLAEMIRKENAQMLADCVTYLNESYNISEKENRSFDTRKYKLKDKFKTSIQLKKIEEWATEFKTRSKQTNNTIAELLVLMVPLLPTLSVAPLTGIAFNESVCILELAIAKGIESIYSTLDGKIDKIFKNITHDMNDGVPEEIMKHLEIVKKNIGLVNQQNTTYGQQIFDLQEIMKQKDATVMTGDLSISSSSAHKVEGTIEDSQYLEYKMAVLKKHIDAGLKDLSDYIQELYDDYFASILTSINILTSATYTEIKTVRTILEALNDPKIKKALLLISTPLALIINKLEAFLQDAERLLEVLRDISNVSPILSNNLDDITLKTKPLLIQMIFEPSHYDDMFVLNQQAQGRLIQMATQLKVVVDGLNENDGAAIRALDSSASTLQKNITALNTQLDKLALY